MLIFFPKWDCQSTIVWVSDWENKDQGRQRDTKKAAVLHKVAEFLTNEESQLARFKAKSWGPSNKKAQQNAEVLANPALAA